MECRRHGDVLALLFLTVIFVILSVTDSCFLVVL